MKCHQKIIDDIKDFLIKIGARMDAGKGVSRGFEIKLGDDIFNFGNEELAPPSSCVGANYAR